MLWGKTSNMIYKGFIAGMVDCELPSYLSEENPDGRLGKPKHSKWKRKYHVIIIMWSSLRSAGVSCYTDN